MQMTVDFVPETMEAVSGIAFLKSYQKKKKQPRILYVLYAAYNSLDERKKNKGILE